MALVNLDTCDGVIFVEGSPFFPAISHDLFLFFFFSFGSGNENF